MKAISIWQPWAWLVVNGAKDVENRTWPTAYRGPILIHAAKHRDSLDWRRAVEFVARFDGTLADAIPPADRLDYGGVVGTAKLVNCRTDHPSPWFVGPFGFVLSNAVPMPFVPARGERLIFNIDLDLIRAQQNTNKQQELQL